MYYKQPFYRIVAGIMRRFFTLLIISLLSVNTLYAQISKGTQKLIKQQAKTAKADGWQSAIPEKSLVEQLTAVYEHKLNLDSDGVGEPSYIIIDGMGESVSEQASFRQALQHCKSMVPFHFGCTNGQKVQMGAPIILMKLKRQKNNQTEILLTCAFEKSKIRVIKE